MTEGAPDISEIEDEFKRLLNKPLSLHYTKQSYKQHGLVDSHALKKDWYQSNWSRSHLQQARSLSSSHQDLLSAYFHVRDAYERLPTADLRCLLDKLEVRLYAEQVFLKQIRDREQEYLEMAERVGVKI
jgi:hypothetical protein